MRYDDYENGKLDGFNEGYMQAVKDAARDKEVDVREIDLRISRIESYLEKVVMPHFAGKFKFL